MTSKTLVAFLLSLSLLAPPARAAEVAAPDVNAFLAEWLQTQNQGRFKDYAALYAKKFQGIKRSGPRVKKMGHDVWLRDREKMFRKPMKVAALDVQTTVVGHTATVRFTQQWESKSYKDTGPKQMVLVAEGGQWRISQEAMIASKLHVSEKQARANWYFVYDGQPILDGDADRDWGRGPIRVDESFGAKQNASEARLPEAIRRLKGEKLILFGDKADTCTATVTGFELVARAVWHFGMVQAWQAGEVPKKEIAEQVWSQAAIFLAATLTYDGKPCHGLLAKPVAAGTLPVEMFVKADEGTLQAAGRLFKKLALPTVNDDEDQLGGYTYAMVANLGSGEFTLPALAKGGQLVMLTHNPGGECGEETKGTINVAHLWMAGRGGGAWKRLVTDPDSADKNPLLIIDVDQDGAPEILFNGGLTTALGLMRIVGETFEVLGTLEIPFYDCGC